jgi:hypothetical protein
MAKKTVRSENIDQVFIYCGADMGIAGLPHQVTLKEAEERGLLAELEAAIKNGSYGMEKEQGKRPAQEAIVDESDDELIMPIDDGKE